MVKFVANPNCCPECSLIDGTEYPDSTNIYDVSHPHCKCWFEVVYKPQPKPQPEKKEEGPAGMVFSEEEIPLKKKRIPVEKLLDAAKATFDEKETAEYAKETGEDPADERTAERAGATFATLIESVVPYMALDEEEEEEMEETKKNLKVLNEQAENDPVKEEFYTGFTYTNQPEEGPIPPGTVETTYDFGNTLVQVSPLGRFVGSTKEGLPVDEEVTVEALRNVVANVDSEILVDFDHASEKDGAEKNTEAAAWASDFMVVEGIGKNDGLYARLKWTRKGREMVEDRTYRFLSPVWDLHEGFPVKLKSIALTNKPALKGISPIINSEPKETTRTNKMDKEILELTGVVPVGDEVSDEEKSRVLEIVKNWKTFVENAEAEKKETDCRKAFNDCVSGYEVEDVEDLYEIYKENPEKFAKVLNACGKKTVKNEEPKVEETPEPKVEAVDEPKPADVAEEPKEPAPKVEEEKKDEPKEVISKEALNSVPVDTESAYDKAMKLHGQAFLDFVTKHQSEL